MQSVLLKVKDRNVKSTDITYDDLVILYEQYIEKYGEVPIYKYCDSKHNMPQGRIINRVLKENGIKYGDFLLKFGKVSKVRTNGNEDYDYYLKRYKDVSNQLGHYLGENELINNKYGLPSSFWFIKYCPDKNVQNFSDFVIWCGYDLKRNFTKENVSQALKELEEKLGRHITKDDITPENVGFSMIVITRLYGSLNRAKKEIGLKPTPSSIVPMSFEECKSRLDKILDDISKSIDRKYISWADIENLRFSDITICHKTLSSAFEKEGVDLFAYIKSHGFMMNPCSFSYHYTFDDGERVVSTLEYDFSTYLKELGYVYNKSYFRDVMYKTFSDEKSKLNCDYKIMIGDIPLYVEIAGIIYNSTDSPWDKREYSSEKENEYRDKMIHKREILNRENQEYLFLFNTEMWSNKYKDVLSKKINEIKLREE